MTRTRRKGIRPLWGLTVLAVLAFGVATLFAYTAYPVEAAAISVNSTADTVATDGVCTLREAIDNANSDSDTTGGDCDAGAGSDVISLPAGTYTLSIAGTGEDSNTTGDLDITDDLTISGVSPAMTIIEAGTTKSDIGSPGNGVDRVFDVHGSDVTFASVSIRYGNSPSSGLTFFNLGGEIAARAAGPASDITLDNVNLVDNFSGNSNGGGISISKPFLGGVPLLTITGNSWINGNVAALGGGGIHCANCTLDVTGGTISGNHAEVTGASALAAGESPQQATMRPFL